MAAALVAAAIVAGACGGTAAPPASPSPAAASPASAPTQAGAPMALTGTLALAPAHGPLGTPVTATASGLRPSTTYELAWTSVKGAWKLSEDGSAYLGRTYTPLQTRLATVTTDPAGAFTAAFTVPERDFGFQHDVLVLDAERVVRNKAGFDVDLRITISPTSGPVGTPITIEARGIGWRQLENSWLVSYDNAFTGWISSVTTNGHAKAVIPATGAVGTHMITVLHGDFTFPYLNMQQSPEAGRPQFHIPFTVTDGPAVLPPAAAAQSLAIVAAQPAASGIWMEPASGVAGAKTTLRGANLTSNAEYTLEWTTTVGNRVSGSGWESVTETLGRVFTDANGALALPFTVPDDLGGAHAVRLKRADAVVGTAAFTIQPSVQALAVDRGPSGTEVLIQLNGVGWTETANIYNITYDNAYAGYACGFNSGGNVQVKLRVSGAPGWHYIDLYPGIYKGQETRPLNFRVPQLTFADDHPGETLPAFHLAFLVTE